MAELLTVGEKGQIVIPKKFRDELHLEKGTKLMIVEKDGKLTMKPVILHEKNLLLLLSEESLKKVWNNPYDARWDDVL